MGDSKIAESVEPAQLCATSATRVAGFIRKTLITAFVVWQVFAVTVWLMPAASGPRGHLLPMVRRYMVNTGCTQEWSMFAPNPTKQDMYISVAVDYADGTHRDWDFPRPSRLGYIERYQTERIRKMVENVHTDENRRIWPYLARYAALESDRHEPGTYPMTVSLSRHVRLISPPPYRPLPYTTSTIFSQKYSSPPLAEAPAT